MPPPATPTSTTKTSKSTGPATSTAAGTTRSRVTSTQTPSTQQVSTTPAEPKKAPCQGAYDEFCHKCKKVVRTHTEYIIGNMAVFVLISSLFLFAFPLIFFFLCTCVRDVEHRCPYCRTHLSTHKLW